MNTLSRALPPACATFRPAPPHALVRVCGDRHPRLAIPTPGRPVSVMDEELAGALAGAVLAGLSVMVSL